MGQIYDRKSAAMDQINDRTDENRSKPLMDETNRNKSTDTSPQEDKLQEVIPELANLSMAYTKSPLEVPDKVVTTHFLIHEYLMSNVPEYNEVHKLRQIGWWSEEGDKHFAQQRHRSDHADKESKVHFYSMMYKIADEMNQATSMLKDLPERPKVLDICMAPGGFSGIILKRFARARIAAITLPANKGGHEICIPNWKSDSRIKVYFLDVTLLSAEMGVEKIPPEHPDAAEFLTIRPFPMMQIDLVFCDGQVLRTQTRASYRESWERERLINSQFVLALQRVMEGGTIVSRLHKVEAVDTVKYLQIFSKFSSIQLFKPARNHGSRSSFYMVARNVQPRSSEALQAVEAWKKEWAAATFNIEDLAHPKRWDADIDDIIKLLDTFGPQLKCLGAPIWKIQADALRRTSYVRDKLAEAEERLETF